MCHIPQLVSRAQTAQNDSSSTEEYLGPWSLLGLPTNGVTDRSVFEALCRNSGGDSDGRQSAGLSYDDRGLGPLPGGNELVKHELRD